MKKKIITSILVVMCLVMSLATVAFATNGEAGNTEVCYLSLESKVSNYSVGDFVDESLLPMSRAATIVVTVTSPCDAEFRATYPSGWNYQADSAIERADDGLYTLYGIDFRSVSQQYWSSSGSTMSDLLSDAKSSHGLTYNGNQTADLMIAFTGKSTTDSSIIGIANVSAPYALIKDGGYDQNSACVQHEVGHTYGCSHSGRTWDSDTACIMYRYLIVGNIDTFCTSHNAVMAANKNLY